MADPALKQALQFIADSIAEFTNTLPPVARRPFADQAGKHIEMIVKATQVNAPEKSGKGEKTK